VLETICVIRHVRCLFKPDGTGKLIDEERLDRRAIAQAHAVSRALSAVAEEKTLALLSSGATRAMLTAEIVAQDLNTALRVSGNLNRTTSSFFAAVDPFLEFPDLFVPDVLALVTHRAFISDAVHHANHVYGYACPFSDRLDFGYGVMLVLRTKYRSMELITQENSP
jgi:phosphohistidine phosphatase SixA